MHLSTISTCNSSLYSSFNQALLCSAINLLWRGSYQIFNHSFILRLKQIYKISLNSQQFIWYFISSVQTIIEKLNTLQDGREKYFSFKMQKLMAEPFVTRCFNKQSNQGDDNDVKHKMDHKRKLIEQKLLEEAQKHNHRSVLQMTLKVQQQKEKKIKQKINEVCMEHEKKLAQRIRKRKVKDYQSPDHKISYKSQIFSPSQMYSHPEIVYTNSSISSPPSKSSANGPKSHANTHGTKSNGNGVENVNGFNSNGFNSNAKTGNNCQRRESSKRQYQSRQASMRFDNVQISPEWNGDRDGQKDGSLLNNPLYLSRLKREIELEEEEEKDMAKAFKGTNFRLYEK